MPSQVSYGILYLVCAMEVLHVFLHHVARCDVSATTKPPLAGDAIPVLSLEEPAKR